MKWKNRKHQASIAFDSQKVFYTAGMASRAVFTHLQTSPLGLTPQEAENRQSVYGKNEVVHEKKKKPFTTFIKAFINPFIGVLTILVIISFVLDVLMAEPGEQEWTSIIVISTMVICSAILRFRQEWKASESSEALLETWVRLRYVLTNLIKPSDELAMVSSPSFNSFQSIRSDRSVSPTSCERV